MSFKGRAVQLQQFNEKLRSVPEVAPPALGAKQILVKIRAAPINPTDIIYLKGYHMVKKPLPTVVGSEGAGQIVQVGEEVDKNLVGKNVGVWNDNVTNSGSWSDYFVTSQDNYIEIPEQNPDFVKYSSPYINPFTVMGFLDVTQRAHVDSVLLNAGASSLAKIVVRLFAAHNIATTILVRKDEQIEEIKSLGAKDVLNQNVGDEQLREVFKANKIQIFFDAVGGDQGVKILKILPEDAQLISYGVLSGQPTIPAEIFDLIGNGKSVHGFSVERWYKKQIDEAKRQEVKLYVQSHWNDIFETRVQKTFPIESIEEAFNYQQSSSPAKGKVVITLD